MERLGLLPARVPLLPGESLQSLLRRHALAMGYERLGLLRAFDLVALLEKDPGDEIDPREGFRRGA